MSEFGKKIRLRRCWLVDDLGFDGLDSVLLRCSWAGWSYADGGGFGRGTSSLRSSDLSHWTLLFLRDHTRVIVVNLRLDQLACQLRRILRDTDLALVLILNIASAILHLLYWTTPYLDRLRLDRFLDLYYLRLGFSEVKNPLRF